MHTHDAGRAKIGDQFTDPLDGDHVEVDDCKMRAMFHNLFAQAVSIVRHGNAAKASPQTVGELLGRDTVRVGNDDGGWLHSGTPYISRSQRAEYKGSTALLRVRGRARGPVGET